MDSFQIVITPTAKNDLIEIRDYIAYVLGVPEANRETFLLSA